MRRAVAAIAGEDCNELSDTCCALMSFVQRCPTDKLGLYDDRLKDREGTIC